MQGRRSDWLRWLAVLGVIIVGLRLAFFMAIPILPNAFAWGGAALLGTALTFLLLPFPHEQTLYPRVNGPGAHPDATQGPTDRTG